MEENANETTVEKGLSLIDLWIVLKKFFFQLVVISVIVTAIVGVLAYKLVDKKYTASAKLIINPTNLYKVSSGSAATAQAANNYALAVYPSIVDVLKSTSVVKNEINQNIRGKDEDLTQIDKSLKGVSCSQSENSLMFTISYTTTTSKQAAIDTVNAYAKALKAVSNKEKDSGNYDPDDPAKYEYPFGGMISVIEEAKGASVTKSWIIYPIIGFVGSFILLYVYFLLLTIFDDSVKSKAEIEEITGFDVIAYIEDINERKSK